MIRIQAAPFDPARELASFETRAGDVGAIVTFTGKVRSASDDGAVSNLHLQHYEGVTQAAIKDFADEAMSRWSLSDYLIIHRIGDMHPGEAIVMVCAGSKHRRDAFEAVDFLMDYLKSKAPFWKKEIREGGETWIEPRAQDYDDADRWSAQKDM